jgi:hypothetical protein
MTKMPAYFFRFRRTFFLITLIPAMFAACASPPDPAVTALHTPAQPAVARVVVLYPAPVMGSNGMVQVKWNDTQSCDLESGSYLIREVVPGEEVIAFSFCGIAGTSRFNLKADEGKTYYIRILPYDSSFRGIVSGYPTEFPPKTQSPPLLDRGPFKIERINEAEAFKELKSLKPTRRPSH